MSTRKDQEEAERERLLVMPLKELVCAICWTLLAWDAEILDGTKTAASEGTTIIEEKYGFSIRVSANSFTTPSVVITLHGMSEDNDHCWVHALLALTSFKRFDDICWTRLRCL